MCVYYWGRRAQQTKTSIFRLNFEFKHVTIHFFDSTVSFTFRLLCVNLYIHSIPLWVVQRIHNSSWANQSCDKQNRNPMQEWELTSGNNYFCWCLHFKWSDNVKIGKHTHTFQTISGMTKLQIIQNSTCLYSIHCRWPQNSELKTKKTLYICLTWWHSDMCCFSSIEKSMHKIILMFGELAFVSKINVLKSITKFTTHWSWSMSKWNFSYTTIKFMNLRIVYYAFIHYQYVNVFLEITAGAKNQLGIFDGNQIRWNVERNGLI